MGSQSLFIREWQASGRLPPTSHSPSSQTKTDQQGCPSPAPWQLSLQAAWDFTGHCILVFFPSLHHFACSLTGFSWSTFLTNPWRGNSLLRAASGKLDPRELWIPRACGPLTACSLHSGTCLTSWNTRISPHDSTFVRAVLTSPFLPKLKPYTILSPKQVTFSGGTSLSPTDFPLSAHAPGNSPALFQAGL